MKGPDDNRGGPTLAQGMTKCPVCQHQIHAFALLLRREFGNYLQDQQHFRVGSGLLSSEQRFLLRFKRAGSLPLLKRILKSCTRLERRSCPSLTSSAPGRHPSVSSYPLREVCPDPGSSPEQTSALGWERKAPRPASAPGWMKSWGPGVQSSHLFPQNTQARGKWSVTRRNTLVGQPSKENPPPSCFVYCLPGCQQSWPTPVNPCTINECWA